MTNRLATNQSQTIVLRWEGEAFGNTPAQELASIQVNLRFPGQYYDQETNLHYNWNRYYDPSIGRYITSDPIELDGGMNTYGYANQNPVRYIERFGLAYFSLRPLEGMAVPPNCFSIIGNFLNLQLSHEQLFFEDSKSPSNLGFFSDREVRPDSSSNLSKYSCRKGKYDDCIMRKAVKNVPESSYCLLGKRGPIEKNNCQNWATRVRVEYNRIKNPSAVAQCKICVP